MPVAIEQSVETSTVLLNGDVGIGAARELKCAFTEALASGKGLMIDLTGVTTLDITTLQLLWAAQHAAAKTGIQWVLMEPVPGEVEQAMGLVNMQRSLADSK
jgi:anti-anti-sigma regulatory factor